MVHSALVQQTPQNEYRSTNSHSKSPRHVSTRIFKKHKAAEQSKMASSSIIQNIWNKSAKSWFDKAKKVLAKGLKPSTLKHYNGYWRHFCDYYAENKLSALPASKKSIVDFICLITHKSGQLSLTFFKTFFLISLIKVFSYFN